MSMSNWAERGTCYQHPLGLDAWTNVQAGRPRGDGIQALDLCQNVCPVKRECRAYWEGFKDPPINIIGGGGWWDGRGRWRDTSVYRLPGVRRTASAKRLKETDKVAA